MKNVTILEVKGKELSFWPFEENNGEFVVVGLICWPKVLRRKLARPGIYMMKQVSRASKHTVTAQIYGNLQVYSDYPARWSTEDSDCKICQRFLDHLGIAAPECTTRSHHFVITKL